LTRLAPLNTTYGCVKRWASLSLALVACSGCVRKAPGGPAPPEAAPAPAIRIPAGCLGDLSGSYVHALNPAFSYVGSDDGGTLLLAVERSYGDAGASGSNPIFVSLSRTTAGFVGETKANMSVTSERNCAVEFPTEVVACDDGGLVLKSAVGGAVDDGCRASQARSHVTMAEHRLIRISSPPPTADAGAVQPE
jgi:hypothetical protein